MKSLERILDKVRRYGCEPTLEGIRHSIRDIAGIRITTSFVSDAFWVAEMLCSQPDLRVVEVKDYIRRPKPNGYQSLHVILQVPVYLSNRTEFVYVEVQIRTVAMDFWASLEHKIYYTYDGEVPSDILDELRDAAVQAAALDTQMAEIRDKVTALREQAPASGQGLQVPHRLTAPTPDTGSEAAMTPPDPPTTIRLFSRGRTAAKAPTSRSLRRQQRSSRPGSYAPQRIRCGKRQPVVPPIRTDCCGRTEIIFGHSNAMRASFSEAHTHRLTTGQF